MKRFFPILLIILAIFAVGVVGCGNANAPKVNKEATETLKESLDKDFQKVEWYSHVKDIEVVNGENDETIVNIKTDLKGEEEDKKTAEKIAGGILYTIYIDIDTIHVFGAGDTELAVKSKK